MTETLQSPVQPVTTYFILAGAKDVMLHPVSGTFLIETDTFVDDAGFVRGTVVNTGAVTEVPTSHLAPGNLYDITSDEAENITVTDFTGATFTLAATEDITSVRALDALLFAQTYKRSRTEQSLMRAHEAVSLLSRQRDALTIALAHRETLSAQVGA